MEYTDMTDEEYDALDEELTRTVPKLGPNESDWLRQRELRLLGLSNMSVYYLLTKATADHKTLAQIIDEMVQEKVTAAAV
ncbi:MAG: hypothetical protein LBB89_02655 [Treponema sp.]|jgi:hypothetical protein|nr:hypothetical protein [Treponema sp.]